MAICFASIRNDDEYEIHRKTFHRPDYFVALFNEERKRYDLVGENLRSNDVISAQDVKLRLIFQLLSP